MTVAAGTGSTLLGGVTLAAGNVDQFTVALDPDTQNEEIVFITAVSSDTFTIVRGRASTSNISHTGGATVRHVLTSDDLTFYTTGVDNAVTLTGTQTLTNKTISASSNTLTGVATLTGTETLTNKTLTSPTINTATVATPTITGGTSTGSIFVGPEERTTVSATAATGTVNFDAITQGVLYYTTNASANWTLNVRGSSGATLNSILATGDAITVAFLVTQGSTAYYASGFQIDGSAVTPKYQGGTAFAAGNVSSIDAYVYTIVKTASATFTVFASQTKFA
jgi:hypothetical protein